MDRSCWVRDPPVCWKERDEAADGGCKSLAPSSLSVQLGRLWASLRAPGWVVPVTSSELTEPSWLCHPHRGWGGSEDELRFKDWTGKKNPGMQGLPQNIHAWAFGISFLHSRSNRLLLISKHRFAVRNWNTLVFALGSSYFFLKISRFLKWHCC